MSSTKYITLTIQQRLDVLRDLETKSVQQVASSYSVSEKTIRRIIQNAPSISRLGQNEDQKKRRRMKKPLYPELEEQLYVWYVERKTLGDRVTDTLLLRKAHELLQSMPSNSKNRLTMGWLVNFKRRHSIRLVRLCEEKIRAKEDAAHRFVTQFRKEIEEENVDTDCIYNMDESGLLWKALPPKTLVSNEEGCVGDQKEKKERVAIALCANANGTHKIKPFFIHKYKEPRAWKDCLNQLPVDCASQKNAWMDQELFIAWFDHFKDSVRTFQMEKGIASKVILLVNDCSAHRLPAAYIENGDIQIRYLPPNMTTLIQPMHEVIEQTKRCFRYRLMQRVLHYAGGVNEFYKKYKIKDCIEMVADAWRNVTSNNIKYSWKHFFPAHTCAYREVGREGLNIKEDKDEDASNIVDAMQEIMSQLSPHNVSVEDVNHYLVSCIEKERRYSGEGQISNDDRHENGDDDDSNDNEDQFASENWFQDEDGDEGGAPTPQVCGIPLNAEEREELENCFKTLEKYVDRASYPLRMQTQVLKFYYLGDDPIYDRPIQRRQDD